MNNNNDEQLIETIYAAATSQEARHAMVKNIKTRFNAEAAGLFAVTGHDRSVQRIDVQGLDQAYISDYEHHYVHCNPWTEVPEFMAPGVIRNDTFLDRYYNQPGYFAKTAYFNEWLKPQGYHHSLTVTLEKNDQRSVRFFLYRGKKPGPFSRQEIDNFRNLARHLARSVSIMTDFDALRAERESLNRILEDMTVGLIFIDQEGRIKEMNRMAERLLETGNGLAQQDARLHATRRADDRRLTQVLQDSIAVHLGTNIRYSGPVAIHRAQGQRPLTVTTIPLPRDPCLAGTRAAIAVLISDPDAGTLPDDKALHVLYDFTPAEARLARHLSRGTSLRETAKLCGISYETARWRLKILFQKTDTRRQAELVRLLLSIPHHES